MFSTGAFGYLSDYLLWWTCFFSLVLHTWCFFRFFPRTRYRKLGLVLGNGLVLACLLGAVAMAGESYFRFVAVETDAFGVSLPARRWFALNTKYNSEAFRDKEWSPTKGPGVRRIAFLGDSFSYGWGIKNTADRFPDQIQSRFDKVRPGAVEVMNIGRPGWATGMQIEQIGKLIPRYDIDEVVLCYVLNDLEDLIPRGEGPDPTRPPVPTLIDIDSSPLVDYLYRSLWLPRVPSVRGYQAWLAAGYADPRVWEMQVKRLRWLTAMCRDRGVALRVVILPYIRVDDTQLDRKAIHKQLRTTLEAMNVEVVDLLPTIADKDWRDLIVNRNDAHPNETAHALFADAIWQAIYADSASKDRP
jgi:lysophospholipase L1-like esterase